MPSFSMQHNKRKISVLVREDESLAHVYDAATGEQITAISPFHEPQAKISVMRATVREVLDSMNEK